MVLVPVDNPVTTPPVTDVAMGLLTLQLPPDVASVSVICVVAQTAVEPVMVPAFGVAPTVTGDVADALPHPLVTV